MDVDARSESNFAWPRRSARRSSTAPERSSIGLVGLTSAGGELVGQRGLEAHVEVGGHRDRGKHEHHAQRALERRPAPGPADALHHPAPTVGEREQHGAGAEAVAERHERRGRRRFPAWRRPRSPRRGSARRTARRRSRARRPPPGRTRTRRRARGPRTGQSATAAPRRRPPARGHSSATPNPISTAIASVRVIPSASPTPSMTVASATIAIVKVTASPSTIPTGRRRRPPTALADSSAGRTGSTHGVIAVPAPATSAKPIRTTMRRVWSPGHAPITVHAMSSENVELRERPFSPPRPTWSRRRRTLPRSPSARPTSSPPSQATSRWSSCRMSGDRRRSPTADSTASWPVGATG